MGAWNGTYYQIAGSDSANIQLYTNNELKLRADGVTYLTTPTVAVQNQGGTAGVVWSYEGYQAGAGNVITDASTARTLSDSDNGKTIRFTSGSAVNVTINTGLTAGFGCVIIQDGGGAVNVNNGTATKQSRGSLYSTNGQYAKIEVRYGAANTHNTSGDRA